MKKSIMRVLLTLLVVLSISVLIGGCQRQSDRVSYNLSLEADNFNVTRKLTVINQRTDTILFQMIGNFSIEKETDGDLAVVGEDADGRYYKHFVYLSSEISYIVEDMDSTAVEKHRYEINFNPEMILPVQPVTVD